MLGEAINTVINCTLASNDSEKPKHSNSKPRCDSMLNSTVRNREKVRVTVNHDGG